jgi:hypothetical protein
LLNLDRKAPEDVIEGIFNPGKEARARRRYGEEGDNGSLLGVEEDDEMGEHEVAGKEGEGGDKKESSTDAEAGTGSGAATPPAGAKRHKWGLRRGKAAAAVPPSGTGGEGPGMEQTGSRDAEHAQ